MQFAISNNHDVQLHIHPHWLETEIKDQFFIPSNRFMLGDFINNSDSQSIDKIISNGFKELTSLCKEVNNYYKCIAYRAGGFNLAPCTHEIISSLVKAGIKYDSSIVPGYYFVSAQNKVDFRKVPIKPNWYLSPDRGLTKEGAIGLWEVPIASIPKSPFELPTSFKLKKYAHRAPASRGKVIHSYTKTSFREKLKILLSNRMLTTDNFTYSPKYLMKIMNYNVRKFREYDEISLALIGHPKSMGKYAFELLESFIFDVRKRYGEQVQFRTFNNLVIPEKYMP